jgi:O-antigen/teichoic acid export membrane protein
MSRAARIMRDSVAVGVRQLLVLGLTIVQNLYAARYLGPQGFGTYALVTILTLAAAIVTPGFLSAAARELPHYRSLGELERERKIVRHMVLGEMGVALLWTLAILIFAAVQDERALRMLLLIAAVSVIPAKLANIYQVLASCDKAFGFQARVEVIRTGLMALIVIGGVEHLGLPLLLGAPVVASVLAAILYGRRYALPWNWRGVQGAELLRLGRIGLPMAGLNVVSGNAGAQRWIERLLIQQRLGTESVGLYSFAAWVALQLLSMLGSVAQAIQPHLYDILAKDMSGEQARQSLARPVWLMIMVSALFLGTASCALPLFIVALVPAYIPALPASQVLLLGSFLSAAYWIPAMVLYSVRVNGQIYYFLTWTAAVLVSALVAGLALFNDGGLLWVAWGFVASQILVLALTFRRVAPWIFPKAGELAEFLRSLTLPLANVALAVGVVTLLFLSWTPVSRWMLLCLALVKAVVFLLLCLPAVLVTVRRTGLVAILRGR